MLAAAATLLVVYLAVSPLLLAWRMTFFAPGQLGYPSPLEEQLLPVVLGVFLAGWTFMFGGAVGSFLNVVAWRMPRGESVVSRPSHCPWCNANIAARDNLPVFGWLLLGGRCRKCRLPISPRYPIVEAIVGLAFLALGVAEVYTGGANLPGEPLAPAYARDLVSIVTSPDARLLGTYAFHCLLLSLLAACALIRYDGHRLPVTLVLVAVGSGLLLSAVWPELHLLPWRASAEIGSWLERFATPLIGFCVGAACELVLMAALLLCLRHCDASHRRRWSPLIVLSLIGLFLGWQVIAGVLLLGGALALLGAGMSHVSQFARRFPLSACYAVAALVQISVWRPLEDLAWWPGSNRPLWQWSIAAAIGATLAVVAGCLAKSIRNVTSRHDVEETTVATADE